MPDMTSDSLTYLAHRYNPGLQYGDHAFESCQIWRIWLGDAAHIFLWLQHNFIETLDQSVWEPVFNSVESKTRNFVFDDNPFTCQCNILWLVSDDNHRDTLAGGTHCLDTESDMLAVDPFLKRQAASASPVPHTHHPRITLALFSTHLPPPPPLDGRHTAHSLADTEWVRRRTQASQQ
ncbi:hypothetical protein GWK47_021290 [Chionoecetes opilio]|uniref:Uncharacterized protein n=1 Tax=Chionoecetes opilio TaxID=41210 RepID=A0A8J5BVN4_CHIOP|nr:hypothetical protein GWK47_021290 [Chionoecetes opilio]